MSNIVRKFRRKNEYIIIYQDRIEIFQLVKQHIITNNIINNSIPKFNYDTMIKLGYKEF